MKSKDSLLEIGIRVIWKVVRSQQQYILRRFGIAEYQFAEVFLGRGA